TNDGGKQARSPRRARRKPLKPSRAGMPGDPGATVVTNACVLLLTTRGCGCNGHPAFPAPFVSGRTNYAKLGRIVPREGEGMFDAGCLMKSILVIPGCAILAQARNPYSLQGLWIPGSRYARPGMTACRGLAPDRIN